MSEEQADYVANPEAEEAKRAHRERMALLLQALEDAGTGGTLIAVYSGNHLAIERAEVELSAGVVDLAALHAQEWIERREQCQTGSPVATSAQDLAEFERLDALREQGGGHGEDDDAHT